MEKNNEIRRTESIAGSSIPDVAADRDYLGFDVYVEAIGEYLTHDDTKGPLALSIEGEWGSGKSSFMLQLKNWLTDEQNSKTVWFNAWRHDTEEALWAAFALRFVEDMTLQIKSGIKRSYTKWKLMRSRYDWRNGWFDLARMVFTVIIWVVIAIAIWALGRETFLVGGKTVGLPDSIWIILGSGGSLAAAYRVFITVRDTADIVGNPLRFDLKKHIQNLNYAERIGFIEKFHSDFKKIVDVYAKGEKVFVFIDDLDRCKVPKAADMMQAMNLMIGADERLIFIVGMDRQKIAAGLAVKFEKLLPYIQLNNQDQFEHNKTRVGIKFGYDFIEKFIQLPFRVPIPGAKKVETFLKKLKEEKEDRNSESGKKRSGLWSIISGWFKRKKIIDQIGTHDIKPGETEMTRKWNEFALGIGDDSDSVQEMTKAAAQFLNYNPRRIKQFINMFRLKAYIAYNTGQFNPPVDSEDVRAVTLEQLAKFVTTELRWPILLTNLEDDPELFNRLSSFAESKIYKLEDQITEPETNIEKQWQEETELLELLAYNSNPKEDSYPNYSLTQLNVGNLLQVSAKVSPPIISLEYEAIATEGAEPDSKGKAAPPDIYEILEKTERKLLSKQYVVDVEIGNKIVNGKETMDPAIRVLVKKKLPRSKLSQNDLIPVHIEGYSTDVIEVGEQRAK